MRRLLTLFPRLRILFFEYKLLKKSGVFSDFNLFTNYLRYGVIGNSVRIEASSVCQLKCPLCPTGAGLNKTTAVGWGFLKFSAFKEFLEKNPWVRNVEISNWGEVLLNPELGEIVKYAYEKKVNIHIANGVNLNFAREDVLESIVKYEVKHVRVSIDGATNETYQKYRIGGDLDKVLKNVERINHYKERYNSRYPELTWQFVIFGHNENEIPLAREMARRLNMRFDPKPNWDSSFSPVKDKEKVLKETGMNVEKTHRPWCYQLWKQPQINWDGKLLGCCVNFWSDFGNAFEEGMEKTMDSEKFKYMKAMLLGAKPPRDDIPCLKCPVYRNKVMQKEVERVLFEE